jgi:hypothetical protein
VSVALMVVVPMELLAYTVFPETVGSMVHSDDALALVAPMTSMPKANAAATNIRFISPTLDLQPGKAGG